jgi:hypothetical protein
MVSNSKLDYSAMAHLGRSLCLRAHDKDIPMAVATAYFDESENGVACVVTGLASTLDRWEAFERDWDRMLKKFKLSSLHTKDYVHSKNEFSSWKGDENKRALFAQRVIEILSRRCMTCIGIVMDRAAFRNTIAQDPLVSRYYVNEYATASFMCLLLVGKWADKCHFENAPNYIFDEGNAKRGDFDRAYKLMKGSPLERDNFGALAFGSDKNISPIQAADFVAYETCKLYTDLDKGLKRFRRSMKSFMGHVNHDIKVLSEPFLMRLIQEMRQLPR